MPQLRGVFKDLVLVATVNAFLTVGFFLPPGHTHDESKPNSSWLPKLFPAPVTEVLPHGLDPSEETQRCPWIVKRR